MLYCFCIIFRSRKMASIDNQIFLWGRHKGRSFNEVYHKDPEFCKLVLAENGVHRSKFIDFQMFLLDKQLPSDVVEERGCRHFIKALPPKALRQLQELVGDLRIEMKLIHEPSEAIPNGFLGVLLKFFARKVIANLNDEDAVCAYVEKYTEVFPFKVSENVPRIGCEIIELFDDSMNTVIRNFIQYHFGDLNQQYVTELFLCNIYNFKLNLLQSVSARQTQQRFILVPESNYLGNFPRLNENGAKHYQNFYALYDEMVETFNFTAELDSSDYNITYFSKLPEINFHELYSLLNVDFMQSEKEKYIDRFKKYLFFFVHALRSDTKPIFFIDELLYVCLSKLKQFKSSRDDIFNHLEALVMLTLVHRRKQPQEKNASYIPDIKNLQDVKKYLENGPNLIKAKIDHCVSSSLLECSILAQAGSICFNMCYSSSRRIKSSDFFRSILYASLCPQDIKELKIYNSFLGEETSIKMPPIKEKIVDFIKKYNRYNFEKPLPAEKFIYWGNEKYFISTTID